MFFKGIFKKQTVSGSLRYLGEKAIEIFVILKHWNPTVRSFITNKMPLGRLNYVRPSNSCLASPTKISGCTAETGKTVNIKKDN